MAEPEIALARRDLGAAREFVNDGLGPVLFDEFWAADDALRVAIDARSAQETSRRNGAFSIVVAAALSALGLLAVTAAALLGRLRRWVIELHTTDTLLGVAEAPTLTTSRTELSVLVVQVRLAEAVMTRSRGNAELERLQTTQ